MGQFFEPLYDLRWIEPGSKGYQFWDAAHQCFKICCDVKFKKTCFPMIESKLTQLVLAPSSDHQIPESDNESDSLGLDLVNLAHPPNRPYSPGLPALGPTIQGSQSARPCSPPIAPPRCGCAGSTSLFGCSSHLPYVDTSHMI